MRFGSLILAIALQLSGLSAWAEVTVAISPRTAKVLDESAEEVCRLARKTQVEAVAFVEDSDLVRVSIKIKGCPEEGYIAKKDLKGNLKGLPTRPIDALENPSEDCANCETPPNWAKERSMEVLAEIWKKMEEATEIAQTGGRNFGNVVRHWTKNEDHRELMQIPVLGTEGNIGPCGSHHYNPDTPVGIDAYVTPFTGCMMTALMQEWRKKHCPDSAGCTLQWGDASHGKKIKFPPHSTHRDGTCIDFRPMRKGEFDDTPLTYKADNYDQDTTRKLVEMARAMGASKIIFNDPKIEASRRKKHDNHLHICFEPNEVSEETCKNLKVEPATCPELP